MKNIYVCRASGETECAFENEEDAVNWVKDTVLEWNDEEDIIKILNYTRTVDDMTDEDWTDVGAELDVYYEIVTMYCHDAPAEKSCERITAADKFAAELRG